MIDKETVAQWYYCPRCIKEYPYVGICLGFSPQGPKNFCGICWVNMMSQFCGELVPTELRPFGSEDMPKIFGHGEGEK